MSRPRKMTEDQEVELLGKINLRKTLSESALCSLYSVSRATLRAALKRAQARQVIT